MVDVVSSLSKNGPVSDVFSQSSDVLINRKNEFYQPVSNVIDQLPLRSWNFTDPSEVRSLLQSNLQIMSSDMHKEVITSLQQLAQDIDNKEIKDFLDTQLPGAKNEARDVASVDRLLELLFALLLLLGKVNIERNTNAAKFAEVSTLQAKVAGDKGISAAYSNLAGTLTSVVLGVGLASVGYARFASGTKAQIQNIQTNVRDVDHSRQMNAALNNAQRRQAGTLTGNSPQERLHTLETAKGKVAVASNQSHLTSEEQHTLQQPITRNEVIIASQDASRRENEYVNSQQQLGGQAIMTAAQHMVPIGTAGFNMQAASANAQAKVNDAEGAVASTVQHSDEQAAQRSSDLLVKIFTMIFSCTDEANRSAGQISQAIRA